MIIISMMNNYLTILQKNYDHYTRLPTYHQNEKHDLKNF